MTYREREKLVYEKFPVTKEERKCETEKAFKDAMRNEFRKQLMPKKKEKKKY